MHGDGLRQEMKRSKPSGLKPVPVIGRPNVRSGWVTAGVRSTSGNQATLVIRGLESNPAVDFRRATVSGYMTGAGSSSSVGFGPKN